MRIYLVRLDYHHDESKSRPRLYSAHVIKETEKMYLCESGSCATHYGSTVKKSTNPSLTAKDAWAKYAQQCRNLLLSMHKEVGHTTANLKFAESELALL